MSVRAWELASDDLLAEGIASVWREYWTDRGSLSSRLVHTVLPVGRLVARFTAKCSDVTFEPHVEMPNSPPQFKSSDPYEVAGMYKTLYRRLFLRKPSYDSDPVLPNPSLSMRPLLTYKPKKEGHSWETPHLTIVYKEGGYNLFPHPGSHLMFHSKNGWISVTFLRFLPGERAEIAAEAGDPRIPSLSYGAFAFSDQFQVWYVP